MAVVPIFIPTPAATKSSGGNFEVTPLSLGLGLGLGLGIPFLCIIACLIVKFVDLNGVQKDTRMLLEYRCRLIEIFPENMISDVERCIFRPNVIQYVSNLNKKDQELVFDYIQRKHGDGKAQELKDWVNTYVIAVV